MLTSLIFKFIGAVGMITSLYLFVDALIHNSHNSFKIPFMYDLDIFTSISLFFGSLFFWAIGVGIYFLAKQTELLQILVVKSSQEKTQFSTNSIK